MFFQMKPIAISAVAGLLLLLIAIGYLCGLRIRGIFPHSGPAQCPGGHDGINEYLRCPDCADRSF